MAISLICSFFKLIIYMNISKTNDVFALFFAQKREQAQKRVLSQPEIQRTLLQHKKMGGDCGPVVA